MSLGEECRYMSRETLSTRSTIANNAITAISATHNAAQICLQVIKMTAAGLRAWVQCTGHHMAFERPRGLQDSVGGSNTLWRR